MSRLYRVSFDTRKNKVVRNYVIDLYAENKKFAKMYAECMWYVDHDEVQRMFHINVTRRNIPDDNLPVYYHTFHVENFYCY